MKIGYLQFNPVFGKPEDNYKKIKELVGKKDADLIVLPELCTSGYNFIDRDELDKLAGDIPEGNDTRFFINLSKDTGCAYIAGIPERDRDGFYNSLVFTTPEGYKARYRKIHLFNTEKHFFLPGNEGFVVCDFKEARLGFAICFDWFFPESLRTLMLKGADIICHPSNLVLPYCQNAMITRSIENRLFTVTSNRTGREIRGGYDFTFTGKSQITSPSGEVLKRSDNVSEEVCIINIDPKLARNKSLTPKNNITLDRQVNFYKELVK
jgi:predicted amidohydrolase